MKQNNKGHHTNEATRKKTEPKKKGGEGKRGDKLGEKAILVGSCSNENGDKKK